MLLYLVLFIPIYTKIKYEDYVICIYNDIYIYIPCYANIPVDDNYHLFRLRLDSRCIYIYTLYTYIPKTMLLYL